MSGKTGPAVLPAFLLSTALVWPTGISAAPSYEISVRLFPEQGGLAGTARILVPKGESVTVSLGGVTVTEVAAGGRVLRGDQIPDSLLLSEETFSEAVLRFTGSFRQEPAAGDLENPGTATGNLIDGQGAFLFSGWYPQPDRPCRFSLAATVPAEWEAISQCETFNVSAEPGTGEETFRFRFPRPLPGVILAAGRYQVTRATYRGLILRTYFFPANAYLAPVYVENLRRYADLYLPLLGSAPYASFSVVENRFQTGLSLPTLTLIGSSIVAAPYLPTVSLGHEFLHQWFGLSVEPDHAQGNWSEGLVAYLADHWYEEQKGKGAAYRKRILTDFANYVTPGKEIPLWAFTGREDFATRSVGYGKGAMVLHMARRMMGDESFFPALSSFASGFRFRTAGWSDLAEALSPPGGKDLRPFFREWLEAKGMPVLKAARIAAEPATGGYRLAVEIVQSGGPRLEEVPLVVTTGRGAEAFTVPFAGETARSARGFSTRPMEVVLDPGYDLFRALSPEEKPPVVSALTGDKGTLVVLPGRDPGPYREAGDFFAAQGYRIRKEDEVQEKDLASGSVLLLSDRNRLREKILPGPLPEGGMVLSVARNPLQREKAAAILVLGEGEPAAADLRRIWRFGNSSLLVFDRGRNTRNETAETPDGIRLPVP